MSLLFYQLVGTGEQRRRNRNAKRLGCSEIDDKLKLRSLLYREVGRLRAFKYFVYFLCMCRRGTERTSRRDPQDGYQGGAASYPHNELGATQPSTERPRRCAPNCLPGSPVARA